MELLVALIEARDLLRGRPGEAGHVDDDAGRIAVGGRRAEQAAAQHLDAALDHAEGLGPGWRRGGPREQAQQPRQRSGRARAHRSDSYQIARLARGACAALATALLGASAAAAEPAPTRPAYQDLRFDEDWSALADPSALPSGDFFDPIKYVELGDGVWVSFGGQLRGRFEAWDGYAFGDLTNSDGDENFGLLRTRAHADLHFGESARVFVELKSALSSERGVFDRTRGGDVDEFDVQNAFVEGTLGRVRLRLGRQELAFARQRLVSPLDWTNTRRTFDGGTLEWLGDDWHTTLFLTRPVRVRETDWNDDTGVNAFYGVHATRRADDAAPRLDLYAYGLEDGAVVDRFATLGGRIADAFGDTNFDYELELAGQAGSDDFLAMMVASQLGWWLPDHRLSPRFFVGFDWASGSSDDGNFDQLFPLGHAYFGAIDAVGRSNLLAASAGVTFRPFAAVTMELIAHEFWLDAPSQGLFAADGRLLRAGTSSDPHHVGAEIDLVGKWQIDPHTALFAGYGHFFPGAFISSTEPDEATDFAYVTLQFTF
jgi:hypothetical protein